MENLTNGDYHITIMTEKIYSNEDNELFTTTLTICNFEQFGKYGKCFEITSMHKEKDTAATVDRLKEIARQQWPDAWKE